MPFNRPILPDIIDRIAADVEAQLPGTDARLRRSLLGVLTRVNAGAVHGLYGYLDFISRQVIMDTAEAEYLERWASIWNVTRKAAAQSAGSVTFTGTDSTAVPQGTIIQRTDGTEFATDADGIITSGSVSVSVTAVDGGAVGDTDANTTLSLVSPIAGVDSDAAVDSGGLTGGADIESDTALRLRLLNRIQLAPHGGAQHDYENWALEVSGVTRAWVFPLRSGAGTVDLTFVLDGSFPITPGAAKVVEVENYINALKPVTATFNAYAATELTLNLTIGLSPDGQARRDAVTAELEDLIFRKGTPGGVLYISQINEAISLAAGEVDHDLVVPVADVAVADTNIYTAVNITWQ